jgi:hypothetical protein
VDPSTLQSNGYSHIVRRKKWIASYSGYSSYACLSRESSVATLASIALWLIRSLKPHHQLQNHAVSRWIKVFSPFLVQIECLSGSI